MSCIHQRPENSRSTAQGSEKTTRRNDVYHSDSTGAAKAIGTVIPELNGKMDGIVLRVQVSNGSIVHIVLTLQKEVTKEEVNGALKDSSETELKGYDNEWSFACRLIDLVKFVLRKM